MQDIFINSFRTCIYSHGTYPNPFLNFWLKMYGSSKAKEGNHRHWILSSNGKQERLEFCSIQKVILTNEQTIDLLYPPALGTIPIGLLDLTSLKPII